MDSREQFEAHIYATPFYAYSPGETLERDEEDGGYINADLQGYWLSWQASRAAVVVVLPNPADTLAGPTLYAQFKAAIEAAGVKVMP